VTVQGKEQDGRYMVITSYHDKGTV